MASYMVYINFIISKISPPPPTIRQTYLIRCCTLQISYYELVLFAYFCVLQVLRIGSTIAELRACAPIHPHSASHLFYHPPSQITTHAHTHKQTLHLRTHINVKKYTSAHHKPTRKRTERVNRANASRIISIYARRSHCSIYTAYIASYHSCLWRFVVCQVAFSRALAVSIAHIAGAYVCANKV